MNATVDLPNLETYTRGTDLQRDLWLAHDSGYERMLSDFDVFARYAQANSTRLVVYRRAMSSSAAAYLSAYSKHGSEVHYSYIPINSPRRPAEAEALITLLKRKEGGPEVRYEYANAQPK